MSENQNRGLRDFSKYDSMSTEELEEILRLDAEAPLGEKSDEELLFYVMGVLADRRNKSEFAGKTAHEAYESFKQHYLPEEKKIDTAPAIKKRKVYSPIRWLRGMTATAAVLALVIFGSMTANAMGFNVWETVVTWAQETFHFGDGERTEIDSPNLDDDLEYTSLQEALLVANQNWKLVPTWIPENYQLCKISIAENPLQKNYVAYYQDGEKQLKIAVRSYLDGYPEQIEQSEGFTETYSSVDVVYYLFSNYGQTKAAWVNESYECYISGEVTIEQLKLMIDSIGEG